MSLLVFQTDTQIQAVISTFDQQCGGSGSMLKASWIITLLLVAMQALILK